MSNVDIEIINQYINECLFEPRINWDWCEFKRRSYARWTAYEILNRLMTHPDKSTIAIISAFIRQVDSYADINEDSEASRIFLIARDTADDILCLFL